MCQSGNQYMPGIVLASEYTRQAKKKDNLSSRGVYSLQQFIRVTDVIVSSASKSWTLQISMSIMFGKYYWDLTIT